MYNMDLNYMYNYDYILVGKLSNSRIQRTRKICLTILFIIIVSDILHVYINHG